MGWRVQDPGWWAFRLLWLGFCGSSFRLFGWAGGGLQLFMDRGSGHNMTSPVVVQNFSGLLLFYSAGTGELLFVLPKGVWTVSTLTSALWAAGADL